MQGRVLLGLFAALVVHLVGARLWGVAPRFFDPFLLVTALTALSRSSLAGTTAGLAAGWLRDTLGGGPYGLHGFADTIVGYAIARTAQRLDLRHPAAIWITIALATLLQQALLTLLASLLLPGSDLPDALWVGLEALVNATVGTLLFVASGRFGRWIRRVEQRRQSRLRF